METLTNLDALLITNSTNIRYLTGFIGVDNRDAYVLITQNKTYFFTNSLYMEQTKHLSPIQVSRERPISMEIRKHCEELNIVKLGFEEADLTVAELTKLKSVLTNIELIPTQERIEKSRQIKRPDEIADIKKACNITDACFDFILKKLKPGVIENDIAWDIETFFRKNDATDAFSPIVAFGKNSSMPHYMPGQTILRKNDLILLDFGARYKGYCADMTRVVFIGEPQREWLDAYHATLA